MTNAIPVIITAAGNSSRMGQLKGLLPWRQQPLLSHQLETIQQVGSDLTALVVTQESHHAYQEICHQHHCPFIINHHPEHGMFHSLQLALPHTDVSTGALLLPLDTPAPPANFWRLFLQFIQQQPEHSATPIYQHKRGHPVYLSPALVAQILDLDSLAPQARLDLLLHSARSQNAVRDFACDEPLITANINTPQDFELLQKPF